MLTMTKFKTITPTWQLGTRISTELATLIEPLRTGKVRKLDFTFFRPITATTRCPWCSREVAPVYADSGENFDVAVQYRQGRKFAALHSPHRCAPMRRHERALATEIEPGGGR